MGGNKPRRWLYYAMEFGKVDPGELEKIDFTLPPDRPETTRVLKTLGGKQQPRIFVE
jgi:hypothetical protein